MTSQVKSIKITDDHLKAPEKYPNLNFSFFGGKISCPITLEEITAGTYYQVGCCKAVFSPTALNTAIKTYLVCPLCRSNLDGSTLLNKKDRLIYEINSLHREIRSLCESFGSGSEDFLEFLNKASDKIYLIEMKKKELENEESPLSKKKFDITQQALSQALVNPDQAERRVTQARIDRIIQDSLDVVHGKKPPKRSSEQPRKTQAEIDQIIQETLSKMAAYRPTN